MNLRNFIKNFRAAVPMSASHSLHCDGKDTNYRIGKSKSCNRNFSKNSIFLLEEIFSKFCEIFSDFFSQRGWHVKYFWVDPVIPPLGDQR